MAKPISKEVRDRIFRAADELYEERGRESFPRVHDVRERAGANMNDIGPCMREWRKLKTAQATPVTIQVQQASRAALALAGGGFATESLRVAQAGWEAEQVEAQEQATVVMKITGEAAAANARVEELRAELERERRDRADAQARADKQQQAAAEAVAENSRLSAEVATLNAQAKAAEESFRERRQAMAEETMRQAERFTSVQADRDQARREEANLRVEVAAANARVEELRAELKRERQERAEAQGRANKQQ